MSTRTRLARLQRLARAAFGVIPLPGGKSHYYDPAQTHIDLFKYAAEGMRQEYREYHGGAPETPPDPPEVLGVVGSLPTRAEREEALRGLYKVDQPLIPFDVEEFLNTGKVEAIYLRAKPEADGG